MDSCRLSVSLYTNVDLLKKKRRLYSLQSSQKTNQTTVVGTGKLHKDTHAILHSTIHTWLLNSYKAVVTSCYLIFFFKLLRTCYLSTVQNRLVLPCLIGTMNFYISFKMILPMSRCVRIWGWGLWSNWRFFYWREYCVSIIHTINHTAYV